MRDHVSYSPLRSVTSNCYPTQGAALASCQSPSPFHLPITPHLSVAITDTDTATDTDTDTDTDTVTVTDTDRHLDTFGLAVALHPGGSVDRIAEEAVARVARPCST